MKTRVMGYDPDSRTVQVVFREGAIVHKRSVNACHDGSGNYDPKATKQRVHDVALGVAHKIELGLIN